MANANLTVANEILRQLGGALRLGAMLGASHFLGAEKALQFRFKARARNRVNSIRIVLDPSDTYTVEFWSIRGARLFLDRSVDGVYADSLKRTIEIETGLALSL